MAESTMYINIPKERAATILTHNVDNYKSKEKEDSIEIYRDTGWTTKLRAELENYNTGKDTKVTYYHDRIFEELEDFIL